VRELADRFGSSGARLLICDQGVAAGGPAPRRLEKEATPTNRLSGFATGLATNYDSVERVLWGRR
jgi:hypothetical protein